MVGWRMVGRLLVLAAICFALPASADERVLKRMRNLTPTFSLIVEGLSKDAVRCGITQKLLETSLRYVLQQSPHMKIVDDGENTIYLNTNVLQVGQTCPYNITLELQAPARVIGNGAFLLGMVWDAGSTGIAPKADAAKVVSNYVEQYAKRLVVDWAAAQR